MQSHPPPPPPAFPPSPLFPQNNPPTHLLPIRHLYIHIPFCPKICPYCSFYKEASDRNKTQDFLNAILKEAHTYRELLQPHTLFFGGGTPSALSTKQLTYLLEGLHQTLDLSEVQEWTLEMNPATVSLEKAQTLRTLGVNRISMGVQSWDPTLLERLGRVHSAEQALRSFAILREAGFENINLDLIFGIPGQTLQQWDASLQQTLSLNPEHIAAYCLTYEEDTDFFLRFQKGEFQQHPETDAELFEHTLQTLENAGYTGYEISNYAQPNRLCQHNLAYWCGHDYLGLGPSAVSTINSHRWKNTCHTETYNTTLKNPQHTAAPIDFYEPLSPQTRTQEQLAFQLRTHFGVPKHLLQPNQTQALDQLESPGLIRSTPTHYLLTHAGKLVADSIAEILI